MPQNSPTTKIIEARAYKNALALIKDEGRRAIVKTVKGTIFIIYSRMHKCFIAFGASKQLSRLYSVTAMIDMALIHKLIENPSSWQLTQ